MYLAAMSLLALALFGQTPSTVSEENTAPKSDTPKPTDAKSLEPFTGKITKNRVRLRLQADLNAPILKEFAKDDLLIVTGTVDDFYAVLPRAETKGYIFRTYVLDGVVEGSHVNVRLEPDTSSSIVCQLNSGEKVFGKICQTNNKWLEISLPESVRFFVAKEFVSSVGNMQAFYDLEKQKAATEEMLCRIEKNMQLELKKPFKDIQLAPLAADLNQIIFKDKDASLSWPLQTAKAEALLKTMQETYLEKSIVAKNEQAAAMQKQLASQKSENMPAADAAHNSLKEGSKLESDTKKAAASHEEKLESEVVKNSIPWSALEKELIQTAIEYKNIATAHDFYIQEQKNAISLKGIIKPYSRHVKNVPGDYVLIDPSSNLPLAYLYSTKVDLQALVGKEAALSLAHRPNNNFAFPAYFVLKAE